jgi:solute carrier family 12 (potassium/chloride transporters), member 9
LEGYIIHSVPAWKQAYKLRLIVFVENREDVEEEKARVQLLLDSLRIEAILIVLCLSSTSTYRCIINGEEDVNGRVDDVLGDDQWWVDLKQLRHASSTSTPMAVSALAQASRAFFNSLVETSPSNRNELVTALTRRGSVSSTSRPSISLALPKRRQSLAVLPHSFSMRIGVRKPGYFNQGSSESSSEEDETDGVEPESEYESDTDQAVASDESEEDETEHQPASDYFASSVGGTNPPRTPKTPLDDIAAGKRAAFSASAHASLDVDDEDKPHVSFKSAPHPHHPHQQGTDHLELDFNILPAKAQYLILNDLIRSHSDDTAVVFTTLPAPAPGTYLDEDKSVEYVSGLELLCEDIPPVLLIHSHSLVVTLAL